MFSVEIGGPSIVDSRVWWNTAARLGAPLNITFRSLEGGGVCHALVFLIVSRTSWMAMSLLLNVLVLLQKSRLMVWALVWLRRLNSLRFTTSWLVSAPTCSLTLMVSSVWGWLLLSSMLTFLISSVCKGKIFGEFANLFWNGGAVGASAAGVSWKLFRLQSASSIHKESCWLISRRQVAQILD